MSRTPREGTGQRHPPRRTLAVLLAAAALLVGCGPSASGPPEQAAPTIAEQWFAARASAQRQGVENLVAFYDPDLVLDTGPSAPSRSPDAPRRWSTSIRDGNRSRTRARRPAPCTWPPTPP